MLRTGPCCACGCCEELGCDPVGGAAGATVYLKLDFFLVNNHFSVDYLWVMFLRDSVYHFRLKGPTMTFLPCNGKEVDDLESVNMVRYLPISDQRLDEIRAETRKDQSLRELSEIILVGWPEDKKDAPALTHPYFSMRDELTVQDGLIFKGNSVVIPRSLRADMKTKIHSSHLGIEACLRRARECIYWPGMSAEMKQYISACETCRELDSCRELV